MSQWNVFAVVPYCKCLAMRFFYVDWRGLLAKLKTQRCLTQGSQRPKHRGVSSGLRERRRRPRHRIDRFRRRWRVACAGISSGAGNAFSAIVLMTKGAGRRRQAVANHRFAAKSRRMAQAMSARLAYAAPIKMPTASTMAPPSTIWNTACRNGVSMYRARM